MFELGSEFPILTRRRTVLLALTALSPWLAACGGDAGSGSSSDSASSETVAVMAGDDECTADATDIPAGPTTFEVTNTGSSVTEVYVYGEENGEYTRVVSEVENIGPGTSRDMEVDLASGTYEIACKPGQTGDGIRTQITVT